MLESYYCIGQFFEGRKKYKWALENYEKAWGLEYEPAYFKMAEFYERGLGCDRNFKAALDIYLQFALWEDEKAIQKLWEIIRKTNIRSELDWVKRASWLGRKSERGTALINKGKEWQQSGDHKGAFNAFHAALYYDTPMAYYLYAECYENGWGIAMCEDEAILYYNKAAMGGISEAYMRMGAIKERKSEYQKALKFYQRAKNAGYTEAADAIWRMNQKIQEAEEANDLNNKLNDEAETGVSHRVYQKLGEEYMEQVADESVSKNVDSEESVVVEEEEARALQPDDETGEEQESVTETESNCNMAVQSESEMACEEELTYYPFVVWLEGVAGMEKPVEFTLYSGQNVVVEYAELPEYYKQEVEEAGILEEQKEVQPWYVRVWQSFLSLFF